MIEDINYYNTCFTLTRQVVPDVVVALVDKLKATTEWDDFLYFLTTFKEEDIKLSELSIGSLQNHYEFEFEIGHILQNFQDLVIHMKSVYGEFLDSEQLIGTWAKQDLSLEERILLVKEVKISEWETLKTLVNSKNNELNKFEPSDNPHNPYHQPFLEEKEDYLVRKVIFSANALVKQFGVVIKIIFYYQLHDARLVQEKLYFDVDDREYPEIIWSGIPPLNTEYSDIKIHLMGTDSIFTSTASTMLKDFTNVFNKDSSKGVREYSVTFVLNHRVLVDMKYTLKKLIYFTTFSDKPSSTQKMMTFPKYVNVFGKQDETYENPVFELHDENYSLVSGQIEELKWEDLKLVATPNGLVHDIQYTLQNKNNNEEVSFVQQVMYKVGIYCVDHLSEQTSGHFFQAPEATVHPSQFQDTLTVHLLVDGVETKELPGDTYLLAGGEYSYYFTAGPEGYSKNATEIFPVVLRDYNIQLYPGQTGAEPFEGITYITMRNDYTEPGWVVNKGWELIGCKIGTTIITKNGFED